MPPSGVADDSPRRRIVVLGAGGFIGRRIIAALLATSWARPVAAVRGSGGRFGEGVETVACDATSSTSLAAALVGAHGVVNSIAGDPRTIVGNARALFDLAPALPGDPRIVHLSTMSVYGSATGTVDEDAPLLGDLDDYGAAKSRAEEIGSRYSNLVCLRPGIVYGPESPQWSGMIGRLLVERRLGDLGERGAGLCNLVHVDDVAASVVAALALADSGGGRAFNLSLSEPPSWNDYFRRYADALGAAPVRSIGASRLGLELRVLGPVRKIGEILAPRLGLRAPSPPLRPWLTTLCRHSIRLSTARAEARLGMRWKPLETGLRETAEWFHAHRAS